VKWAGSFAQSNASKANVDLNELMIEDKFRNMIK
jgi:hypothetical protein